jgi:uncharacterized phage protein gp47/JayE
MPSLTQSSQALQILAQLRLFDPSVSAEIGTPERKIIDSVAEALSESQIDLSALSKSLDISSKYGSQLDRFLSIFGFSRQKATYSTGYVTFGRPTPATVEIRIPTNTLVQSVQVESLSQSDQQNIVRFATIYDGVIPVGGSFVTVPVRCLTSGPSGNVAANRLNLLVGPSTPFGITSVTNDTATQNGVGDESDAEYKIRFQNTVFRNLAGTEDQYIALAIATAFTSKANVVGSQSRYREYIQVPPVDDSSSYDINNDGTQDIGAGNAGSYTTALSGIPYAKQLWTSSPVFVSNGRSGLDSIFYRQDSDFKYNTDFVNQNHGDTYRLAQNGLDIRLSGNLYPNITFLNVYNGANPGVSAVRPGDILLLEFEYLSNASRNDIDLKITNCVDVFIDGGNDIQGSTVVTRPTTDFAFVDDESSKYHYENYRRVGDPNKRPILGNVLQVMFWQPTVDVPDQIVIENDTYDKGTHYWAVYDISPLSGTIRSRNGIEWSTKIRGRTSSNVEGDISSYSGKVITDRTGDSPDGQVYEITNYTYDKNIIDLQSSLAGSKQITTDVLAHKAKDRFFKLDLTVMYSPSASQEEVNLNISNSLDLFLRGIYFGSVVQLSDLLSVIHGVPGVDNVRWSSDTPGGQDLERMYETNIDGQPLTGVSVDLISAGASDQEETQALYITGQPTGGTFALKYADRQTTLLPYNASADEIRIALNALHSLVGTPVIVTEDIRGYADVRYPIRSFRIKWVGVGAKQTIQVLSSRLNALSGGPFIINNDFFLRDDELARLATAVFTPESGTPDSAPGIIARPRAQNTWIRS